MTGRPILPTPLVSTDWLAKHLCGPDLRVLDATAHLTGPESGNTGWSLRLGLDDYLAAHIPGAVFADVLDDLSEPDGAQSASLPRRGSPRRPAGWASARFDPGRAEIIPDPAASMVEAVGREHPFTADYRITLLDALRTELDLTGTGKAAIADERLPVADCRRGRQTGDDGRRSRRRRPRASSPAASRGFDRVAQFGSLR